MIKRRNGWTLETRSADIIKMLRQETQAVCDKTAHSLLSTSNQNIRSNVGAPGRALGSAGDERDMPPSGYVITSEGDTYDSALANTTSTGSRDVKRGLILPKKSIVQAPPGMQIAFVSYLLQRAALMHNGYLHARAGKQMIGTPFLSDAAVEKWPNFIDAVGKALAKIESVHVLSVAEKQEIAEVRAAARLQRERDMFERRELAAARRDVQEYQGLSNRDLLARHGKSELSRQKGETMGEFHSRIREIKTGESDVERNERILRGAYREHFRDRNL